MSVSEEWARVAADALTAETERWCWLAIGKGVGWRVWRSEGRTVQDSHTLNYSLVHDFQLLEPCAFAPGTGTVYGPFSMELRGE